MNVIWDGRRSGPGGAYLFHTPEQTRPAEPLRAAPVSKSDQHAIVDLLRRQPMTMRALINSMQVENRRVNAALYLLRGRGVVAVFDAIHKPGAFGRTKELVYGLVDGAQ